MSALAINPKVRKVLPLCGSPVDAEALAACRRVGALLERDGLSYVDLADALPVQGAAPIGPAWDEKAWRAAAGPQNRPHHSRVRTFTERQSAEHRRMALWVRNAEAGRLSVREREFIHDIAHRRRELTIAQADWLAAICDRLAMEGRRA